MTDNSYDDACRFLGGEDRLQAILVDLCNAITYELATELLDHLSKDLPLREFFDRKDSEQTGLYFSEDVYVSVEDTNEDVPQLTFGCCVGGHAGDGVHFPLHQAEDGSWGIDSSQPPSWVIH